MLYMYKPSDLMVSTQRCPQRCWEESSVH